MISYKPFLGTFLIAGTLLFSSCGSKTSESALISATSESVDGGLVKIESLSKISIPRSVNYTASVSANEELQIAPATAGRINLINVEIGDHVKKGKILFNMDETNLQQSQIQLSSLAVDLARLDTLLKKGSVSKQTYDQMKTQYDVAQSNVEFLSKNVAMQAPFDGIITGRYFEAGEIYSGSPSASSGGKAAIVTLQQIDTVKVIVSVSERYFNKIKKGMQVTITSDMLLGEQFSGNVSLIYPTIDATSRSFNVEVTIPNRNEKLRPGMFVRVHIDLGTGDAFAVHSNTVLMQNGTNARYVYVENNGIVKRVNVTLGDRFDDFVEIISDELKEGDHLIIEGQARLSTGNKVTVVK